MKRLIAFLSLFFIFGIASAECVIYGYRVVEDEHGNSTIEKYVRARYEGSCSPGDHGEVLNQKQRKPTADDISWQVEKIKQIKKSNADTSAAEKRLYEMLAQ